jgi:hypothetical protein
MFLTFTDYNYNQKNADYFIRCSLPVIVVGYCSRLLNQSHVPTTRDYNIISISVDLFIGGLAQYRDSGILHY